MPMAEANYHPKVPILQSAQGRIKLRMDHEPSRFAARRNKPGCSQYQKIRKSPGRLRIGTVRVPPSLMQLHNPPDAFST